MSLSPLRPIFVGGCQRSGTTFLGALLGSAPGAVTVPESNFRLPWLRARQGSAGPEAALDRLRSHGSYKPWNSAEDDDAPPSERLRDLMEFLVRRYARDHIDDSPRVWVDHSPQNTQHGLLFADEFPEARFVHIVRDGRAVAASVMPLTWGPNTIDAAARYWVERVAYGMALETSTIADRVIRVRYEDLLEAPESTLRRLCDFCDLAFVPEMLQGGRFDVPSNTQRQHALVGKPPEAGRARAWEDELSDRDVEIFEAVAGPLLVPLGYAPRHGMGARSAGRTETARMAAYDFLRRRVIDRRRKRTRGS